MLKQFRQFVSWVTSFDFSHRLAKKTRKKPQMSSTDDNSKSFKMVASDRYVFMELLIFGKEVPNTIKKFPSSKFIEETGQFIE